MVTSNAATGYVAKISLANIDQNQSKTCQNQPKTPKVNMLKFGMLVLILASNGAIQRSNRICSQDRHADLGHISLGQQPILASISWNVRNIVWHVRHVRNVRNIPGPWEHCSDTTQGSFLQCQCLMLMSNVKVQCQC